MKKLRSVIGFFAWVGVVLAVYSLSACTGTASAQIALTSEAILESAID